LWSTGDVCLWVELNLLVKNNASAWQRDTFRVDIATDITTYPAFRARQLNLPIPLRAASGASHNQTGLEIRSGLLRFRIEGMDATEYAAACFFLGDPQTPPTGRPAAWPRKLLQPLALLDHLRFIFEKNATVSAPHGEMIIEKK
jgi:hypothetical protein